MSFQTVEEYLSRKDAKFTRGELACRHCGLARFHPGFLEHLHTLRLSFAQPMTLTSGCRCQVHNANVGGNKRSLHIGDAPQHAGQNGTLAVDVATPSDEYRGILFAMAWQLGWSIGWGRGFLHLDRRDFVGLAHNSFDY